MRRRYEPTRLIARGLPILLGVAVTCALVTSQPRTRAGAAAVTIGGPFMLSTSDGKTVTDRTYRGKWLLVYFGYTSCPNSCPTMLLDIAAALKQLGPDAGRVQPLFITIDPQRDTAAVMQQYTQSFDPRIVGLSGTAQQIATVAQEYGAYYVRRASGAGATDYVMDHSTYLYVMDPEGKFVRAFQGDDASAEAISGALRELMKSRPHEGTAVRDGKLAMRRLE